MDTAGGCPRVRPVRVRVQVAGPDGVLRRSTGGDTAARTCGSSWMWV
ncbi:hypothetical protein ABZT16_41930 [Streptomyces flaveolus]